MKLDEAKQILNSKGSYGVRVFKNIEDFKAACAKVGLHPNLSDYE